MIGSQVKGYAMIYTGDCIVCKHIVNTEMISTHDGMCNYHHKYTSKHRCIPCTSMISLCQNYVCSTCVLAGALRHSASTWTFLCAEMWQHFPWFANTIHEQNKKNGHLFWRALTMQLFTFNLSWPQILWTSQTALRHFPALTPSK